LFLGVGGELVGDDGLGEVVDGDAVGVLGADPALGEVVLGDVLGGGVVGVVWVGGLVVGDEGGQQGVGGGGVGDLFPGEVEDGVVEGCACAG